MKLFLEDGSFLPYKTCRFSLFNMLESGFRTRKNKRSNRIMEVKLNALLGNYDGPSADLTVRNRRTDQVIGKFHLQ